MKKALITQPDCSLVRPRSPRTVLSATAMALRLTYTSAAAAHSQANTANRTTLGRAEDCFSLGCGSLISVLTLRASVCPSVVSLKYLYTGCADFGFWRGATREHPPQWGCDRGATKPEPKSGATRRAACLFCSDFVVRSSQIPEGYARHSRLV